MNPIFKIAIIAAGAWFLLRDQLFGTKSTEKPGANTPAQNSELQPAPAPAPNPPAAPPAAPPAGPVAVLATAAAIEKLSAGDPGIQSGKANYHVWAFYFSQVKGTPAPAPQDVGQGTGLTPLTLPEFMAAIATKGLSGFRSARRAWGF